MEKDAHQLLNFIVFVGLLVTIGTTVILPSLNWDDEKAFVQKSERKSESIEKVSFSGADSLRN